MPMTKGQRIRTQPSNAEQAALYLRTTRSDWVHAAQHAPSGSVRPWIRPVRRYCAGTAGPG